MTCGKVLFAIVLFECTNERKSHAMLACINWGSKIHFSSARFAQLSESLLPWILFINRKFFFAQARCSNRCIHFVYIYCAVAVSGVKFIHRYIFALASRAKTWYVHSVYRTTHSQSGVVHLFLLHWFDKHLNILFLLYVSGSVSFPHALSISHRLLLLLQLLSMFLCLFSQLLPLAPRCPRHIHPSYHCPSSSLSTHT